MKNWFNLFPRNLSLSIYVWMIFSLLPFYFIFVSTSPMEIILGIVLIVLFFIAYLLSFLSNGPLLYVCVSVMMLISIGMSIFYGYVYFSLFIAFYIGNVQHKGGFISLYVIHLVTSTLAASLSFFTQKDLFFSQLPFIMITILGVILLPISTYNRIKRIKLEEQLSDANKRISQLMVYEERQRIARDLHDTLGQKLSLIGLKSDLAGKLLDRDLSQAKKEIADIHHTARLALKEVREMLSNMRGKKLNEELEYVQQLLQAANIEVMIRGEKNLHSAPVFIEHVLSMCLREAVTNVVKHSQATKCTIRIEEHQNEFVLEVSDNGVGITEDKKSLKGHGLTGILERLEFVNGECKWSSENGTTITIKVPNVLNQSS